MERRSGARASPLLSLSLWSGRSSGGKRWKTRAAKCSRRRARVLLPRARKGLWRRNETRREGQTKPSVERVSQKEDAREAMWDVCGNVSGLTKSRVEVNVREQKDTDQLTSRDRPRSWAGISGSSFKPSYVQISFVSRSFWRPTGLCFRAVAVSALPAPSWLDTALLRIFPISSCVSITKVCKPLLIFH